MLLKICKSTKNYSFRLFYQINYRPTKADKNSEELLAADRHVEKYKEVLDKICRKFVPNPTSNNSNAANVDQDARDKRCKKVHEYKLAQSMEESLKDLPDGVLRDVLENCGKWFFSAVATNSCFEIQLINLIDTVVMMICVDPFCKLIDDVGTKFNVFFSFFVDSNTCSKIGEKHRHRNHKQ